MRSCWGAQLTKLGLPTALWHFDEMVVKIGGGYMYLWRAVNEEGEVLGMMLARFLLSSW